MAFSIYDIYKQKLNIISLSIKLLSTTNTNEEISINSELKKEAELLLSLLNIKNVMMMSMNNFNPMTNQNYAVNNIQLQQLMQKQLTIIEQMMQKQQIPQKMQMKEQNEKIQKKEEIFGKISVTFLKSRHGEYGNRIVVQCDFNEKIEKVIERYRNSSSDFKETEKFMFNAKVLNQSMTVAEAGIYNNCTILVVETSGIRGG